jgi:hypothetical protein
MRVVDMVEDRVGLVVLIRKGDTMGRLEGGI